MGASTYSSGIAIGGQIPITAKAETQTTGTVTVGAGALILKEGGSTAANLTCQAKKIEATDTTLTCTTDTALPATDGKAYTLALGENLDSKITKSEPGDSLTYAVGTNVAFAYSKYKRYCCCSWWTYFNKNRRNCNYSYLYWSSNSKRNVYHRQIRFISNYKKLQEFLDEILDKEQHNSYLNEAFHWFTIGHENKHSLGSNTSLIN